MNEVLTIERYILMHMMFVSGSKPVVVAIETSVFRVVIEAPCFDTLGQPSHDLSIADTPDLQFNTLGDEVVYHIL